LPIVVALCLCTGFSPVAILEQAQALDVILAPSPGVSVNETLAGIRGRRIGKGMFEAFDQITITSQIDGWDLKVFFSSEEFGVLLIGMEAVLIQQILKGFLISAGLLNQMSDQIGVDLSCLHGLGVLV